MKRCLFVLMLTSLAAAPAFAQGEAADRSLVEVLVTFQETDPHFPWRREPPGTREGYGVVVGPGRVITTESLVRNATLIELRLPRQGVKIPASVIQSDPQVGAALLQTDGGTLSLTPVQLAPRVTRDAAVRLVQLDDTGSLQATAGRIIEISVDDLPNGASYLLTFKVLADLQTTEHGTPVFSDGQLAGLVLNYDKQGRTGLVLPAQVLTRFMNDTDHPPYKGLAAAGFTWEPLVNPTRLAYLGLTNGQEGIEVQRTIPRTGAAEILKPGDVIVQWEGHPIDAQGYYVDPDYGRLLLPHLINGCHFPGDSVPLTLIRDGLSMQARLVLKPCRDEDALIPQNLNGAPAEYLMDSGLVIRELTADYLFAYGPKWMINAHPRLVHLFLTKAQFPEQAGDRIVILAAVLPDLANIGYQQFRDEIITRVNGDPIRNLSDVFRIADRDGGVRRLSLVGCEVDLVLDPAQREKVNKRLAALYGIPELRRRLNASVPHAP